MKTKILLVTAMLVGGLAWGQETNQGLKISTTVNENIQGENLITLELNQTDNSLLTVDRNYNKFKRGDFFRIRIKNLNTYLFKVEINNEDVDNTTSLPSNLLSLVDLGGLGASLANLNTVSSIIKTTPEVEGEKITDVQEENLYKTLNFTEQKIKPEALVKKESENHKKLKDDITTFRGKVDKLIKKVAEYQTSALFVSQVDEFRLPNSKEIQNVFKKFNEYKEGTPVFNQSLKEKLGHLETIKTVFKKDLENNKKLSLTLENLLKINATLTASLAEIEKVLSADNFNKRAQGLADIHNNRGYSYTSYPIQRHEDVNKITVKVTPRDSTAKLPSYSTVLRIPDYEKDFWGVSMGFYRANNFEEVFSVRESLDNPGTFDLVEEEQSESELGINAMIRYGFNISRMFYKNKYGSIFWQFGLGAGLTINEEVRPRLFLGMGPAFGRKNKIVVDFGAIYMFYDRLSSIYDRTGNQTRPEEFLTGTTKISWYVSLGYIINLEKSE